MQLLPIKNEICAESATDTGNSGWLPPLEAKCNWAPSRRCTLLPEGVKATVPWEYNLPKGDGAALWKSGLGDHLEDHLKVAGSFHMRLSWKKKGKHCMTVFEAWADTDNDGLYYADVVAMLFGPDGKSIEAETANNFTRPGSERHLPKTRAPGPPVPLTLDVFLPDPAARKLLNEYIQGQVDGTEYPGPLEDYAAWREKQFSL